MSWLTATMSKVREQGGALLRDGARGLRQRAAGIRPDIAGHASDIDARLEARARHAAWSSADFEELCRCWARQLDSSDPIVGDKYRGGRAESGCNANAEIRQALLRSSALEILFEAAATDETLRAECAKKPFTGADVSVLGLHDVLSRTVDCSEDVLRDILRLAFGGQDLLSKRHVDHLVALLKQVKKDWGDDAFHNELHELTQMTEALIREFWHLKAEGEPGESDKKHRRRVEASLELLNAYWAMWQNLEETQDHNKQVVEDKQRSLDNLEKDVSSYSESLIQESSGMGERQKQLQCELRSSHDGMQEQLKRMDEEISLIDDSILHLDFDKRDLRAQLDHVVQEMQTAEAAQRAHMQSCDEKRRELNLLEEEYKQKIKAQDKLIEEAARKIKLVESLQATAQEVDQVVEKAFHDEVEDLTSKSRQFDAHFVGILNGHLVHEMELLDELEPEIRACVAIASDRKNKIQLLNVMDMSSRNVMDSNESKRLSKGVASADAGWQSLRWFIGEFGEHLAGTSSQSMLQDMERRYEQLHASLTPCREVLGIQAPMLAPLATTFSTTVAPQVAPVPHVSQPPPPPTGPHNPHCSLAHIQGTPSHTSSYHAVGESGHSLESRPASIDTAFGTAVHAVDPLQGGGRMYYSDALCPPVTETYNEALHGPSHAII